MLLEDARIMATKGALYHPVFAGHINAGTQEQLAAYRQQIDSLDQRIIELFQQRARVVEEVGNVKREAHLPVTVPGVNLRVGFGMELTATDVLPPPPKLAFNEISPASTSAFWLEIINYGKAAADLSGIEIVRSVNGSPSYTFPAQTLAPGAIVAVAQTQLGFGAQAQNKLFLYNPGRFALLDAVHTPATEIANLRQDPLK